VPAQGYGNPVIRLHDTGLGRTAGVELRDAGKVSMYVCGPTVYDLPHIGHGRMALVWDVLRRYLEWTGLDVRFVSNVTDIDDKIIQRAIEERRSSEAVALEYEAAWYDAMDRLGVKRPTVDPHATAYVDQMVDLIAGLIADGTAYETSDGVYFSVEAVPGYGLLARQSLDSLRSGARVDVVEEKRSPVDFALWKRAKPGEPTWPAPWGDGRPGWHTECVVMSLDLLGEGFDLHGGGIDLAFPHHENERAQAIAAGREFSRRWAHNGHVQMGGEKMSPTCWPPSTPGRTASSSCSPTTGRRWRSPGRRWTPPPARWPVSTRLPAGWPSSPPAAPMSRLSTVSAPPWTTTSTRPERWPSC
jgi:cysteinyl-tRNA synthetase